MLYVKIYIATMIAGLAIDSIWLGVVARNLYKNQLGSLLAESPNWFAAIAFYLLFVVGVVVFAIAPAISAGSPWKALALGSLLGLVTYATYDLTNHATLKNWPLIITLVDLAWGTFFTATISIVGYFAGQWMQGT